MGTGIDFLAPAIGNVHGNYGPEGPRLDFERLEEIVKASRGRLRMVLHGTNDFAEELLRECVRRGSARST